MKTMSLPVANSLLAALPRTDYQRMLRHLDEVTLRFGEVLYESQAPICHVYFPTNALISLLTIVEGHLALEVGLVGREGMLGISVGLGIDVSPVQALVQGKGTAMRMSVADLKRQMLQSVALREALHRYTYQLMAQVTQTAACNRFHVVSARLARWLLMTRDRVRSTEFHLTQEFLGHMLGVRRVGVTKAATALKQRKLIRYSRGNIAILDERGLERASCKCYEIVRKLQDGASLAK